MQLFNRELSWLSFNERVLQESLDPSNPLVERIRFLGIYSNNLDEFFRVRVASVSRLIDVGKKKMEGYSAGPKALHKEIKNVVLDQQRKFEFAYEKLLREFQDHNIVHVSSEQELEENEMHQVHSFFREKIRPHIVPIMLSNKRPMPELRDKGIYLAIKMTDFEHDKIKYALVEVPPKIFRFFLIPTSEPEGTKVMLLDDIIRLNLPEIFSIFSFEKIEAYTFKITRDAELDVDDDISKSYLEKMQDSIQLRKKGEPIRFVYDSGMPHDLLLFLMEKMDLQAGENIIPGGRYHNFKDFMGFPDFGRKDFIYKPLTPSRHPAFKDSKVPMIEQILKKDILVTYPYQSFQHIIDVVREAAIDPKVISIKMNLYRVASNSQIINALISAARNGKKVTVIIELLARFDEANNIKWSEYLEDHGVNVLFGVQNVKVHSKLFLIKRKAGKKTQLIAHVGTGNFHEKTARIYTDCSLLTANLSIANEVEKVFKILKNNIDRSVFRELHVSPFNLRRKLNALIDNEIKNAQNGEDAYIYLKLNNLVDSKIIKKLYEASAAGVKVHAIIRGICALIPGEKGLSENIEVRSIVGRFLEHTRIMIFANGGDEQYYISSADWMTRNLDKRIEVSAPIFDPEIQKDLRFMIDACLKDNTKARAIDKLQKNRMVKSESKNEAYNSQMEIYDYFRQK
ncbi:MAG: polyphosphate kinase 1 [Flavobacteriales bacterium]|nr:polyphosphate kinase 1 [Flavobacteriales bacterium]